MDRRIQAVISRMESDPAVQFSELAAMVNLSESRLRHLFKKESGTTYKQYVREMRLKKAETLLRTTFLTMKEIATSLGLSSSHFVREFKKVHGISPIGFRLRNGLATNRTRNGKKKG